MRSAMQAVGWWLAATVVRCQEPPAPAPAPGAAVAAPAAGGDDLVDDEDLLARIEAGCEQLRAAGVLHTVQQLRIDADGRHCDVPALPARQVALASADLRAALLPSTMIVGHYYHCAECASFHFTASSGFAVARDGIVATCFHLLADDEPDEGEGEGTAAPSLLAVADLRGRVFAVTEVLAADRGSDVAVLRCTATDLQPLPLRVDARAGEPVYCLSHPDHLFACFSAGVIARRYRLRGPAPGTEPVVVDGAPGHAAHVAGGAARSYFQVTCDFGSGSSGGPIVDSCGNLVGIAQSTSSVVADPEADRVETQMVARTATPAAALSALLHR